MLQRTLALVLVAFLPCVALAQDAGKRAQIKELMRATGASKIGVQFAAAISQELGRTLRKARPDIPERVFGVLQQEMLQLFEERIEAPGGLMDRVVPIYEKHFTSDELSQMLAFYRTPAGRKAVETLPAIMSESVQVGQAWGQSLGPEINRRVQAALKREGIELPARK